jgi:hypothetical protein
VLSGSLLRHHVFEISFPKTMGMTFAVLWLPPVFNRNQLALNSGRKVSAARGGSMAQIDVPLSRAGFGQTQRADSWWVQPLVVFLGLSAFIAYSTWAALQGQHFRFGPYLSPFYSPELFGPGHEGWFGRNPRWMPVWVTGAMLILWAPGGFRVTCY